MSSLGLFLVFLAVMVPLLAGVIAVLLRGVSVRFILDIAPDASQQAEQPAPAAPSPRKRVQTIAAPRPKGKRQTTDPAQPYTAPHHADTQHPHALGTWGTETAPHGHSAHSTHATHTTGNAGGDE